MKKEIMTLPRGAKVTLKELNNMRKKANHEWKHFKRLEKVSDMTHSPADMEKDDAALDIWAESFAAYNAALTGRERPKRQPERVTVLEHDPCGPQFLENV